MGQLSVQSHHTCAYMTAYVVSTVVEEATHAFILKHHIDTYGTYVLKRVMCGGYICIIYVLVCFTDHSERASSV